MKLLRPLVPAPCLLAHAFILAGCPANNTGDEGASTTEHGTTEHGTTEQGTTEHGTTEHGTTEQGTTEHGTHDGIETSADDPAVVYCSCVFSNCHDAYHEKWGEDEMASEAACLMEAEALPVNGSDIEMGNFIECRMHFCELAADDESLCANALGDAVCV
jgi:hypothetical protein